MAYASEGEPAMPTLIQDLRYSVRQLVKSPGFTLTAVISLALGMGATTAVFSVIYAALLDPYPFPAADRIVRMAVRTRAGAVELVNLNPPQIQQRRQVRAIENMLAMDYHAMTMTGHDLPENVNVIGLISNGFDDLGVPPVLGRGLLRSDAIDGQDPQPAFAEAAGLRGPSAGDCVGGQDSRLVARDRRHRGGCQERRAGKPHPAGGFRALHAEYDDGNADPGEDGGAAAHLATRGADAIYGGGPGAAKLQHHRGPGLLDLRWAGVAAGAPGRVDLRSIWRFGTGSGGDRALQRGLLHSGAADQRIWYSHGLGRPAGPSTADRFCVDFGKCGERDWGRSGAHAGPEYGPGAVGKRQLARSRHSNCRCAPAELCVWDCLRNTGVARLQSRSHDGATL